MAGGLTQVSVVNEEGTGTESKSGFSVAGGLLLQNWSSINIGLVFGQDRIGDREWEHEGDWWTSFMVGWNLTDKSK